MAFIGSVPDTPLTAVRVEEAKSWVSQEIFWMGVFSSVVAGLIVLYGFEQKVRG